MTNNLGIIEKSHNKRDNKNITDAYTMFERTSKDSRLVSANKNSKTDQYLRNSVDSEFNKKDFVRKPF